MGKVVKCGARTSPVRPVCRRGYSMGPDSNKTKPLGRPVGEDSSVSATVTGRTTTAGVVKIKSAKSTWRLPATIALAPPRGLPASP